MHHSLSLKLQLHHNEWDCDLKSLVSWLFTQPFVQAQIKKTSKLHITGLCEGSSLVNSSHKGTVTRKMFPLDDVIMYVYIQSQKSYWGDFMFSVRFRVRVRQCKNFSLSRQNRFELNHSYLAQRIYGSGEMYWMTFPWPWPKVMAVASISKNLLVCTIKWE